MENPETESQNIVEITRRFGELTSRLSMEREEKGFYADTSEDLAAQIINLGATPEIINKIIFENPPAVYIKEGEKQIKIHPGKFKKTECSESEKDLADSLQLPDKEVTPEQDLLRSSLGAIKSFLEAPSVKDGFKTHEERRAWERGILNSCVILDKVRANLMPEETKVPEGSLAPYKREYTAAFKRSFDNNKYSKNMRLHLVEAMANIYSDNLLSLVAEPPQSTEGWQKIRTLYSENKDVLSVNHSKKQDTYRQTSVAKKVAREAANILSPFTRKSVSQ